MKTPCSKAADTLNRLLGTLRGSFACYLRQAHPWAAGDTAEAIEVINTIATEQEKLGSRIARVVQGRGVRPAAGRFPTAFFSCNDLALNDRLLKRVVELHQADLETIRACVQELVDRPQALPLAEAVLRAAASQLDALQGLLAGEDEPAAA